MESYNKTPKIRVYILNWNGGEDLKDSINSLQSNKYENFSITIIDNNSSQSKESSLLKLNCDKAINILKWNLAMDFQDTVRLTTEWYKSFYNNLIRNLFYHIESIDSKAPYPIPLLSLYLI